MRDSPVVTFTFYKPGRHAREIDQTMWFWVTTKIGIQSATGVNPTIVDRWMQADRP